MSRAPAFRGPTLARRSFAAPRLTMARTTPVATSVRLAAPLATTRTRAGPASCAATDGAWSGTAATTGSRTPATRGNCAVRTSASWASVAEPPIVRTKPASAGHAKTITASIPRSPAGRDQTAARSAVRMRRERRSAARREQRPAMRRDCAAPRRPGKRRVPWALRLQMRRRHEQLRSTHRLWPVRRADLPGAELLRCRQHVRVHPCFR
jgi:hypothetical protein